MELKKLERIGNYEWRINPHNGMRVPALIYASRLLVEEMDDKVYQQISNVASLPGIVGAACVMPDAHWGYGFPIGGVAAFDPASEGVVSAGGVGFDISCGVRMIRLDGIKLTDLEKVKEKLSDELFSNIPAGVGSESGIKLGNREMDKMLAGGAVWAIENGFGYGEDMERMEGHGIASGALPGEVSANAKERLREEIGSLGSGNHYLEVQRITEVYDLKTLEGFGLEDGDIVISIHCGSRGLGHQIGTDYLREMALQAESFGINLPDRELACAPIDSGLGCSYIGAMRAGINCALANRQVLTHFVRQAVKKFFPGMVASLIYDVSHNTCKEEIHETGGRMMKLFVHRKGATGAFGPGYAELPEGIRDFGQPVMIGGSMGTCSYLLAGTSESEGRAFSSSCHGAGRAMSRHQALKKWRGSEIVGDLNKKGIIIRSASFRGVAEEAPLAYKDVNRVVDDAQAAGLSRKVAKLAPVICIKG
jgi:tRNA-splicing ligase RtcB